MSVVGNNLTSLQRLAGYPRFSDDGNLSLEERYACLYSSVSTLLPARGAVHPDFTTYLLKRRSWERDGDSAIVTLIYGIDGVGSIPVPGGTAVQDRIAISGELIKVVVAQGGNALSGKFHIVVS